MSDDKTDARFNEIVKCSEGVLRLLTIIPDGDYNDKCTALGMAISQTILDIPSDKKVDYVDGFCNTLRALAKP